MNKEIKKKLTSNWFRLLQHIICNDIEELENKKIRFVSKKWKRNKIKDEGGGEYRIFYHVDHTFSLIHYEGSFFL